jgi:hypothetical protein
VRPDPVIRLRVEGRRADVVLGAEDLHGRAGPRLLQDLEHLLLAESTRSQGFDVTPGDSSYQLSNFRGQVTARSTQSLATLEQPPQQATSRDQYRADNPQPWKYLLPYKNRGFAR